MSRESLDELMGIYLEDPLDDLLQEYLPDPQGPSLQAGMGQVIAEPMLAPPDPLAASAPLQLHVSQEARSLWLPTLGDGSSAPDAVRAALSAVIPATSLEESAIPQDLLLISKFYLGSQKTMHTSKEAIADILVAQIARCNRDVRCDSNRRPPNR